LARNGQQTDRNQTCQKYSFDHDDFPFAIETGRPFLGVTVLIAARVPKSKSRFERE